MLLKTPIIRCYHGPGWNPSIHRVASYPLILHQTVRRKGNLAHVDIALGIDPDPVKVIGDLPRLLTFFPPLGGTPA